MKKFLLLIALIISGLGLNAQSVGSSSIVYYDGYSLKFTVTKLDPAECKVVCDTKPTTPGAVSIPSSVTIEGSTFSVTSIGESAFSFSNLTGIEIPSSVTSIGNYAFGWCNNLTGIEIPNSVTSIGDNAFDTSKVESIIVVEGNPNYDSRNNCNAIIETQTNTLLYGCKNTIIPNTVTYIGEDAFDGCIGLTNIEIPNSVTSIGVSAFFNCSGLTSIEIPNSVTFIGEYAFYNCNDLTSIEIPNSVTSIGVCAFRSCYGLKSIVVEGGNTNYDSRSNCNAIIETQTNTLLHGCKNTVIPNSVTSIGESAFRACYGLTSIEIPNSVTSIGNSAFEYCSGLTSIKCHSVDVPVTATDAFNNCPEDMTIQVPEESVALYQSAEPWKNYNVTEILLYQNGDYVVIDYEGYSLRYTIINVEPAECEVICETKPTTEISITIPSSVEIEGVECSVTKIGNSAFSFCSGLTSIEIPNSVTSIGYYAFYSCSGLTSIEIPNSVTSIGNSAFSSCDGLESFVVEGGNPNYDSRNNCNAIIETQTNTLLYGCMNTIIPNNVTSIGNSAFYDCDGLTSIEIPNNVTSIGNSAFSFCSGLTSIEIPNSVTSIGNSAFYYCNGLTSIEIPNSVTSIGNSAFAKCSNLTSVKCQAEIVPETEETAFDNCPSDMNIQVPEAAVSLYKATSPWNNYNVTKMYPYQNGDYVVIDYEGYSLRFTIENVEPAECEVVCETEPETGTSITIPSSVEIGGVECSVTKIGNAAFSSCYYLMSIEIPNSVTSIGNSAFYYCNGLTSIEIPNSVTSIGERAFYSCSHLRSIKCHAVDVPVTATNAFNNCPEDMNIQVPEGSVALYQAAQPWSNYNVTKMYPYQNGDYVVIDYEGYSLRFTIENVEPAECEVVCETELETGTSITIPSSVEIEGVVCNVTKIGNSAFYSCSGLTSIEIPNSVTSIGNYAFYNCSGLTSIEIPNSVTSIGNSAFYYCNDLTSIEIPNSVTSIGYDAFSFCNGLTSIEIPNSVTSIGESAFISCSSLERIVVESGNTVYDSRNNCNAIIETQTNTLLYGCMNTIIPNSVTSIGNYAFFGCDGLTSIEIPNSVTSIGNYAFYSCSGLTSIEIPNSVTSIGYEAFRFCNGLTSIEIPNSVTSIGNYAFTNCSSLERIVVESGNTVYDSRNNCNAIIETQTNTLLYGCMNTIIPNSVTSIGNEAFYYCNGLTSIEIPNSVTSIGNEAFCWCNNLTSIEIPNSVTSIGESAFFRCSHLRSIKCQAEIVPETEETAFDNCPEDMNIQVPAASLTLYQNAVPWNNYNITPFLSYGDYSLSFEVKSSDPAECIVFCSGNPATETSVNIPSEVTIGDVTYSVTTIGYEAFIECSNITSIVIPNSVTTISPYAFDGCTGLTSIMIPRNVTTIERGILAGCINIATIEVDDDNSVYNDRGNAIIETETNTLVAGCKNTVIPDNTTKIADQAFRLCSTLTEMEIPNTVTYIGTSAFYGCTGLTGNLVIPNSVTYIGGYAFGECRGFDGTLTLPNNIDTIREFTFGSYDGVMGFTGELIIPNNVKYIGQAAFQKCSSISGVKLSDNLTRVDRYAFTGCSSITEVEIPNDVTYLGAYSFANNSSLTELTFEDNSQLDTIAGYAFTGCESLLELDFPNSLVYIGMYSFANTYSLTSIRFPSSLNFYGLSAFTNCRSLESIIVDEDNTSFDSRDNCNALITSSNVLLLGCKNTNIPDGIVSIRHGAFLSCIGLTSIDIPATVNNIGNSAFNNCSNLTNIKCLAVDVPVTATNAFNNCPEDMTIQVPEGSVALYQAAQPWNNFNIVAGFNSTINLTSNIEEGGFVEGSGNYQDGTEITVYAYVNPNYGFLYWSEDEEIVSYSPEYTFTVSNDRNLVANFAINHWIPDYTIYPNTMAVVGVVQIDGIEQNSSNIEIGAFCGNELRGSNRLFYESKYDRYYLYLTIYGKDDDEISFKIYDHTIESELKLYYNETINFSINDNIGSSTNPMIFNFTTEFLHKRQLSSNWNWYSTFVAVEGRNGFVMLTEGLGELGIQVKSQFAFSNYETGDWNGALKTVSTENMYMIKMSEPTELGMSGIIVEPSEFPIVLNPNWKWIPYSVSVPMDVTTAFAEFTPHDGDIVKSQEGFTQYYEGIGWSGSLNTMIPGEGYMYQNTSGEEKTLYYPTTGEAKGETKTNITSENNYWKPEINKYPTNMSVIAVVDHSDELDFEVAAFSNGECRGSARPIYIDGLDKNILFLTIYGEDNETIAFRYYDANSGEEYNISNRIIYSTDSTIGNVKEPYVINLIPANVNEITENEVCIYPNPVNTNSEIHLTTECDRVEVYNSLGVKISEHENVDRIDGIVVSGVYIIKVVKEGVIKYNRIVVK